jgi:hypothetical protein
MGMEIDPLRWIQSGHFTFAAMRRTGKPPEIHSGSMRLESDERGQRAKPDRKGQMPRGN